MDTMKLIKVKYAVLAAGLLLALGTLPFVSRATPMHSSKSSRILQVTGTAKAVASSEPLSYWQYPQGVGYGAQLSVATAPDFPDGCLQGTTDDPIEKVYAFYRDKATAGAAKGHGFNWQNNSEMTLLVNQPMSGGNARGGMGITGFGAVRHLSDCALIIVHQPTQTVIVKITRDAQNRSATDVSVILDKR
jgi:hypothetical protein